MCGCLEGQHVLLPLLGASEDWQEHHDMSAELEPELRCAGQDEAGGTLTSHELPCHGSWQPAGWGQPLVEPGGRA